MPKAAAYRLTWLPEREAYELRESQSKQVVPMDLASHAWFAWLAAAPSFTFSGRAGQLTVRQEIRPRGGAYWYACRRIGKKTTKRYLGRTVELTPARLEEVAAQLAEAALARSAPHAEAPTQHMLTSFMAPLPDTMAARETSLPPPFPQFLSDGRLATKLQMPHMRPRLIQRTHLIEHLQQGMEAPLTLISAPAGSGKTTLLAQWLAEHRRPVAWMSLEPADNDPVRFLSVLIAALQQLDPWIGTSALACLHPSPPSPPPSPETIVDLLVSDLHQQARRDVVLVLDDYHLITTEVLQRALILPCRLPGFARGANSARCGRPSCSSCPRRQGLFCKR